MGLSNSNKPITLYENSWAHDEFKRTHKPVTAFNVMTGRTEIVRWEKIHLPLPEWWGKPAIIGSLANAIPIKS